MLDSSKYMNTQQRLPAELNALTQATQQAYGTAASSTTMMVTAWSEAALTPADARVREIRDRVRAVQTKEESKSVVLRLSAELEMVECEKEAKEINETINVHRRRLELAGEDTMEILHPMLEEAIAVRDDTIRRVSEVQAKEESTARGDVKPKRLQQDLDAGHQGVLCGRKHDRINQYPNIIVSLSDPNKRSQK